jgi:TolA-binding protein
MSITKNQAVSNFNDGNKLYKVGLFKEALEQYQKATENDPTSYDAHFCIAKTRLRLKECNAGTTYFKKYLELIPKAKQGDYVLALSNILLEENKPLEALKLTESIDVQFTEEQTFKYLTLLLANGKTKEAIHKILNLKDKSKISIGYSKVLEDQTIPEKIITELKKDNIIPRFFNTVKKVQLLKNAEIQHKEYNKLIEEVSSKLSELRKNKNSNYISEFEASDKLIEKAQSLLAKQTETILKTKNFASTKKLITILEQTKYDSKITNNLTKELNRKEKSQSQKTLKIAGISIASIVILSLAGYFGYNSYQKSEAREYTLRNATINSYTNYLNKYGSDKEIDKLREDKLYEVAITTNNGKDFAQLSRNYPNSKYLRTINIAFGDIKGVSMRSYGLGDINQNTDVTGGKTLRFKAPIGSKVGYTITKTNNIPINRVFTVSEDLNITENFELEKELVFSESFNSNKNSWNTFDNSKKVYGRTKNKGVQISNGELQLFNEISENQFTYSSVNTKHTNNNGNFELETSISRNNQDRGTFVMFGMSNRAFNYIAITKSGTYQYGYNDWNNKSDSWVVLSNGWKRNNAIRTGNYDTNTIKISKTGDTFTFYINDNFIGTMPKKRWYGNRIGFGINDRTSSKINSISISKKKNRLPTQFIKGNTYFCWVDELNVRSNATKKGEIIKTIKLAEPVRLKGGIGAKTVNATFKGIFSPEKYYEVELLDGTIGWVHGGTLNEIPSDKTIDFKTYQ